MGAKKGIVILIVVLLFAGQFIGNYGNYQLAAIPGSIYQAFNLDDMQFSSLMTGPMLPSIFLSIVVGVLVDRFGISKIVGIWLGVAACGFIIRCFATDYPTMLLAMALSGFGAMVINSNLAKIASSLFPMDKVSLVVGVLMAASTLSMATAFATTAMLPSLEVVFWIPAIASIVVFACWILFARESTFVRNQVEEDSAHQVKESLRTSLKSRNVWLAGLTLALMMGSAMVLTNFHVTALTTLQGYSEAAAGSFNTVLMVGAIIGSIALPSVAVKFPSKTPYIVLVMLVVTAATCYGMVALSAAGIYVCAFLNGMLRSGVIAVLYMTPVLLEEIGPKHAGTAGGLIVTIQLIGAVIIPTYVIVPLGGGDLITYFVFATVCMALAAVLCFIFMKTCGAFSAEKKA